MKKQQRHIEKTGIGLATCSDGNSAASQKLSHSNCIHPNCYRLLNKNTGSWHSVKQGGRFSWPQREVSAGEQPQSAIILKEGGSYSCEFCLHTGQSSAKGRPCHVSEPDLAKDFATPRGLRHWGS